LFPVIAGTVIPGLPSYSVVNSILQLVIPSLSYGIKAGALTVNPNLEAVDYTTASDL
jgi:hypothetical protein